MPRSSSNFLIWLVCIGIGLLFMARGAFQNYVSPFFQGLEGFSYAQIAILVYAYGLAQSISAPIAGWYTDRTSARFALGTSIVAGLGSFLLIAMRPGFTVSAVAVFIAGLAFILGKISLNTILVVESSAELLRTSVAKRATLLNLGSFFGNSIAQVSLRIGYGTHAIVLGLLYLPLGICLAASGQRRPVHRTRSSWGMAEIKNFCKNRGFLADALRRFALVLPYGCWGTIIPIYVQEQTGSISPTWVISLTSVCTTIVSAYFLSVQLSAALYKRGFRWEWWSMTSVVLYCVGLLLLMFCRNPFMLPVAIVVFIFGEVLMTPCFDETAKRHSTDSAMGTCMGLLHLVDGFGRTMGAAFALAVYGWMRHSAYVIYFWPVVVLFFFVITSMLHLIAFAIARAGTGERCVTIIPGTAVEHDRAFALNGAESEF